MIPSMLGMRSSSEPAAVLVALRRIVRYLRVADREVESALGLSAAQLFVLHTLSDNPARSIGELAERTLTDQSSVSTVVARLVARKLVVRKTGADRRRAEIHLSPAGERIVLAAPRAPQVSIIAALRAMSAPRRGEVVRALEHLASAIGANEVAPTMLFEDEPRRRKR
jgi:DNA-binding MarR family transcriptional regulator